MKIQFVSSYKKYLYGIISIAVLLLIWFLINLFDLVNVLFIPKIGDTFSSLLALLDTKSTYYSLFLTVYRSVYGLILALIVGIPIGLLIARVKVIHSFLEFPVEFFRAVPASALFPLFILFFGVGDASKVGVSFYACSLIILINAYYGALPTPEKLYRINMLKTLGANRYQIFYHAVIKDAMSSISAGVRVCLSYSFALVVVTEMFLAANDGIGKLLYDYYLQYNIPEMYATIILLGLTGFLLNQLYLVFERKFLFWINKK